MLSQNAQKIESKQYRYKYITILYI